ncbi:MAG: methylmalonyl-CoA epimerase, partial [Candidatus Obscuribacterales bacterium]|nr:methylmalonyl-CoA epimerase [Candidatus Obscuribacterales bacterium]
MDHNSFSGHAVDHIAIAVKSLDEALAFYKTALGLHEIGIEVVAEQGVRVAKLDIGNTHIELLEPLGPETPVGKFLTNKGPGLHHICVKVDDINSELAKLKSQGMRLIDETPKIGAGGAKIAFVHPKSTGGVLLE